MPLVFMQGLHPEVLKVVIAEIIIWTLAVVWLFRCIEKGDFSAKDTPMNKPMLAFLAAVVLSFIFSRYPKISMIDTIKSAGYMLLFFLVVNFIDDEKKLHKFLNMMMIAASAACIYGFMQRYGFSWIFPMLVNRTTSTFLNPNFFAAFLIMMLPVAAYLYFRSGRYSGSFVYLVIIMMMLASLVCTFTRAAWAGCIASFVFMGIADFGHLLAKKRKLFFLVLVILVFFMLTFSEKADFCPAYAEKNTKERVIQRIESSAQETHLEKVIQTRIMGEEEDISALEKKTLLYSVFDEERRIYYGVAANVFADNIVLGSGPGTFGFMIPDYLHVKSIPDIYYKPKIVHAHNEYLQIMAETGFIGIAMFAWLVLAFFFSCYSIAKKSRNKSRNIVIALAAGVIAILLHNIFDVGLRYPSITIFFWIFMGLVFASQNKDDGDAGKSDKKGRKRFRPLFILAILALSVVFFVIGARVIYSEIYTSHNPSITGLQKAIGLNPYSTDPYLMLAVRAKNNDDYAMMIRALKGLDDLVPGYFAASYSLGIAYYQIGDYDNAIAELDKVKDRALVEKWIIFSEYRKEHNIPPWETVNATIYLNG